MNATTHESTLKGTKIPWEGNLSLLLVAMVQSHRLKGQEVFSTRTGQQTFPRVDPDHARGFSTNYNYLVHFGFCSKERNGEYRLMEYAFQYVDGEKSAPDYIIAQRSDVVEIGPRVVHIRDVTDIDDLNAHPLWWEEEARKVEFSDIEKRVSALPREDQLKLIEKIL